MVGPDRALSLWSSAHPPTDFVCLKRAVSALEAKCGRLSDYALKYVRLLVNLCEQRVDAQSIADAVLQLC